MKRNLIWIGFVLLMLNGMLHVATIRRKDDPVRRTQTDPITHKQKVEELEEGVKGPPTPSFTWYPNEEFLADPPVDDKKQLEDAKRISTLEHRTSVSEGKNEDEDFDVESNWWYEDWDEKSVKKTPNDWDEKSVKKTPNDDESMK